MKIKNRYTKKDIEEIVDKDDNLIGSDDVRKHGSDMESQASNTTDYNQKVGTQPFRYDMLGRFGFTLMPFFEGKNQDIEMDDELKDDLAKLMYEKYIEILKYYYKNPNKLKSDYRKFKEMEFENQSQEDKNIGKEWGKKIMKVIEPHFMRIFQVNEEKINESYVIEDKVVDEKSKKWMDKKSDDKEVIDKKGVEKIVGLLNKLDKNSLNQIIDLVEKE